MVLGDVKGDDQSKILCWVPLNKIKKAFPLGRVGPSFPNGADLNDHPGGRLDVLSQSEEALEDGPGFRLRSPCHASDGAFPL